MFRFTNWDVVFAVLEILCARANSSNDSSIEFYNLENKITKLEAIDL